MFIVLVLAAAAVTSAQAAATGTPTAARNIERSIVGGAWTGKFLQKDWTFVFSNEDGRLQGRYITSGGRNWQPLKEILVSGRSVSFSIESKPEVDFSLEFSAPDRQMAGTVTVDGFGTIPFLATRTP